MRFHLLAMLLFSGAILHAAEPAKPSEATQKAMPQDADVKAIQTLLAQRKLKEATDINARLFKALGADVETWKEPDLKARFEAACKLELLFKNAKTGGGYSFEPSFPYWIGLPGSLDELVARVKFSETLLQGRPKQEYWISTGIRRYLLDHAEYSKYKERQPVYNILKSKGVNEKYLKPVREFFRDAG